MGSLPHDIMNPSSWFSVHRYIPEHLTPTGGVAYVLRSINQEVNLRATGIKD